MSLAFLTTSSSSPHSMKQYYLQKHQARYHSMECRTEKVTVVAEIVEEIRLSGARFLRRNGASHLWEEVHRKTAVDKVRRRIAASLTSFILLFLYFYTGWPCHKR